ncbi:MAG: hypothetical protein QXE81_04420 [Desulfurococcaceae archaeon]
MFQKAIFLTDLDETIITKEHSDLTAIKSLLSRISTKALVIPVTMKTLDEVLILSRRIEFTFPFIISEGGCVIAGMNIWFLPIQEKFYKVSNYYVGIICKGIEYIDNVVTKLLNKSSCSDKTLRISKEPVYEIQEMLNLSLDDAVAMKNRTCSEVLLVKDMNCLLKLSRELAGHGLTVLKTRRFLHVLSGSKARGVQALLDKLRYYSDLIFAAGDSEVDCDFLSESDTPLVIGEDLACMRKYPYIVLPYKPITRNTNLDKVLSSIGL